MSDYISKINKNNTDYDIRDAGAVRSVNNNNPDASGNVVLNEVPLANNLSSPDGTDIYGAYILRTSAGAASIESGRGDLIYVAGNTSNPTKVVESIVATITTGSFSVSIDYATWRGQVSASGTYVFSYNGTNWSLGGSTVTLADYGITLDGTATNNDAFSIAYAKENLGQIIIATPTSFKATGLNAFDKTSMIISDATIDSNGEIIASSGNYVAYCQAVGGLTDGYTIYDSNATITAVGYSNTLPAIGDTVDITVATGTSTSQTAIFANNGYLAIACTSINTLCVHPKWSGTEDTTYEAYNTSSISIPTTDADGNNLPTATYGLPNVGSVRDTIDFAQKEYIQRIGHYAYSAENLATVQAMGVDYQYDLTHIFYVLEVPVTYRLSSSISSEYSVADFGTEQFVGTSVDVFSYNMYGSNLKDKLRNLADIQTIGTGLTLSNGQLSASSSGGPTVVQTTGTSTTDVMSQNAVTSSLFADPGTNNNIRIGNTTTAGNQSVNIGYNLNSGWNGGTYSVAIGRQAGAGGIKSVSVGASALCATGTRENINIGGNRNSSSYSGVLGYGDLGTGRNYTFLIGYQTSAGENNTHSVALGSYSSTSSQGEVSIGGSALGTNGYNGTQYRLLTNVHDGQSAHDAANVGQLNTLIDAINAAANTNIPHIGS